MTELPTTTTNHNRPPSTTSGTTTDHHQRNRPSPNDHHQQNTTTSETAPTPCTSDNRTPPMLANLWQLRTFNACEPPTTAHLQHLRTSDDRTPLTTAHLWPPLRSSLNSKHITHLLSLPIFIIPLMFIHHPQQLK